MNLSRAAKKFREQMPKKAEAPRPAAAKKAKAPAPAPEPAPQPVVPIAPVEPTPEPVAIAPAEVAEPTPPAQPKKAWPEKVKRPRFVREKTEKPALPAAAAPALPPRSTKFTAQLLTKNLSVPPSEDPKTGR